MPKVPEGIRQAAAIPVRDGQICVITSSSGKRWVVPKGCLERGKTATEIAEQEAWEEAGLVGHVLQEPVGYYLYEKWGSTCHVTVFVMEVSQIADDWPEHLERQRHWLRPSQAIARVSEGGLRAVLRAVFGAERVKVRA